MLPFYPCMPLICNKDSLKIVSMALLLLLPHSFTELYWHCFGLGGAECYPCSKFRGSPTKDAGLGWHFLQTCFLRHKLKPPSLLLLLRRRPDVLELVNWNLWTSSSALFLLEKRGSAGRGMIGLNIGFSPLSVCLCSVGGAHIDPRSSFVPPKLPRSHGPLCHPQFENKLVRIVSLYYLR